MLLFYLLLGFLVFFCQHLLPFPPDFRLDLVTLFVVFVTLRRGFLTALGLALLFGFVLDCYGLAPLGLQAAMLLTAVIGTSVLQRHLNLLYVLPQIAGVALVLFLQSAIMLGLLHLVLPVPVVYPAMLRLSLLQLATTAVCAPAVLGLFNLLERGWQHWLMKKSTRTALMG